MSIRVLLIEDDKEIADFVLRGLREEGFTVEYAADGEDGGFRLRHGTYDIILLDWWLPGFNGLELLEELRAGGDDTAVLFLTARDGVNDRVKGLDSGADDYLCKPFAFAELLARIRVLTRRREQWSDTVVRYSDVCIDIATHQAERDGKRLDLTAKEESLLLLFLRHPGTVFSRTQLYERVWDEHYDGLSNTLEVHIMGLRRKLESKGPRLIHTLRGRGYVLESLAEPCASS